MANKNVKLDGILSGQTQLQMALMGFKILMLWSVSVAVLLTVSMFYFFPPKIESQLGYTITPGVYLRDKISEPFYQASNTKVPAKKRYFFVANDPVLIQIRHGDFSPENRAKIDEIFAGDLASFERKLMYFGIGFLAAWIGAAYLIRTWGNAKEKDESVRQRTDYAKEVAQAAQAGRFEEAFAIMAEAGKLHITSREQATTAIAERIASGEDAVFSAMKNSTRANIINAVDSLRGDQAGVTISAAMPVATNESDRRYFGSYKQGNIVLVNGEIEGFKKGERLTIQGGSHENNSVTFLREDGSQASLNMFEHGRSLSQYSISEQTFHVGDQIAYTKNINTKEGTELSIRNSIRGTVKSINEQAGTFVVENEAGKITQHRDGDFITRADALTVYKTQGLSEQTAIAAIFTDDRASTNAAYVALTRMKEGMELYTDDPAALAKALAAENKTSTLDYESAEVEAMKSERINLDSSDQSEVLAEKLANMRSHEQTQEQEIGQALGSSQRQEQEMSLSL